MAQLRGPSWSGNVGVRFVQTEERRRRSERRLRADAPPTPGAITTSAFGSFYQSRSSNTYNDVLPSANLKFDLDRGHGRALRGGAHDGAAGLLARSAALTSHAADDADAAPATAATRTSSRSARPTSTPTSSGTSRRARCCRRGVFYMDLDNYVALRHVRRDATSTSGDNTARRGPTRSPCRSTARARSRASSSPGSSRRRRASASVANYTYADGKETSQ